MCIRRKNGALALTVSILAVCWIASVATTASAQVCGDGVWEPGEACEDGNIDSGDGCSATCVPERSSACGNAALDAGEACDDGNAVSGDGCSATCTVEEAWVCDNPGVDELVTRSALTECEDPDVPVPVPDDFDLPDTYLVAAVVPWAAYRLSWVTGAVAVTDDMTLWFLGLGVDLQGADEHDFSQVTSSTGHMTLQDAHAAFRDDRSLVRDFALEEGQTLEMTVVDAFCDDNGDHPITFRVSSASVCLVDTDLDGVVDEIDVDDDDDGIVDVSECNGSDCSADTDDDGIPDYRDPDAVSCPEVLDGACATLPQHLDADGDDVPNHLDLDSDADGVPDNIEGHDDDADGVADTVASGDDADDDGLDDAFDESLGGRAAARQDTDDDATSDWLDADDDGDQIATTEEDTNGDGDWANDDCDDDGRPDYLDADDCRSAQSAGYAGGALCALRHEDGGIGAFVLFLGVIAIRRRMR